MPRVRIEIEGLRCARCGHEWIPRKDWNPLVCPKCKSPFWDRERTLRNYRAEALIQWRQGGPPDQKKLADFERQLGAFRRPRLAWVGKRLRVSIDVRATNAENAVAQGRRHIVGRLRGVGLSGYGVKTKVDVSVKATD